MEITTRQAAERLGVTHLSLAREHLPTRPPQSTDLINWSIFCPTTSSVIVPPAGSSS